MRSTVARQTLIRCIRFRAGHRGTREADLLVSAYVEDMLKDASEEILQHLEDFLRLDDQVLIDVLSGVTAWPKAFTVLRRAHKCDGRLT